MKKLIGILLIPIIFVLGVGEFIAIVDPKGTKMADDSDPFGPPPPWWVHAVYTAVILSLRWTSYWLLTSRNKPNP